MSKSKEMLASEELLALLPMLGGLLASVKEEDAGIDPDLGPVKRIVLMRRSTADVYVRCFRELGQLLLQISDGSSAHRIFHQHDGKRQQETKKRTTLRERVGLARAYWGHLASDPKKDVKAAMRAAKASSEYAARLSDKTIENYRNDLMHTALSYLQPRLTPQQYSDLWDFIKKHRPLRDEQSFLCTPERFRYEEYGLRPSDKGQPSLVSIRRQIKAGELPGGRVEGRQLIVDLAVFRQKSRGP